MKLRQWVTLGLLSLLVAAAAFAMMWTREAPALGTDGAVNAAASSVPVAKGHFWRRSAPKQREQLVDQRPLQVARSLVPLATTLEEQRLVQEAMRVADHEVDLAFADALRAAAETPKHPTPEVKDLFALKVKAEAVVTSDQQLIAQLAKQAAASHGPQQEAFQDQMDVAKAQAQLDQDELDSAAEDLEREGGDPQAKIKRLIAAHEASDKEPGPVIPALDPSATAFPGESLLSRFKNGAAIKAKLVRLEQARDEATSKAGRLDTRHDSLAQQVQKEKDDRESAKTRAAGFARGMASGPASSQGAKQDALDSLKQYMKDQRTLADLGKRIQDERDLAEVYGDWITFVQARQVTVLHALAESALWILAVLLGVYGGCRLVEHLFGAMERRRAGTLRSMLKLSLQILGIILIVFVILGVPTQTTTVLGLAGAGLTVAMKDFIVAFFGWFILIGRNGVHVGDWVEIKGVGGEVVEIGMLRTVLLETGSWSDAGHPTGRRVAFVNSFAIEGHYFNFTTSGQWMWDELIVQVPVGQDPYPVLDGIQKLVAEKTESNAKEAEQEWQRATTRYKVQDFSAAPGINVVPTNTGVEIHVRYITRAYERHQTRQALYQSVVELMHGKRPEETPAS
jgi:small-conductance mechanosensitive channel